MVFENIGFTRNVKVEGKGEQQKQGLKWLICAECDMGKCNMTDVQTLLFSTPSG